MSVRRVYNTFMKTKSAKNKRPSWDEYFMMLVEVVRTRADCTRRKVGALIVKDYRIISTGYNGTPHNIKNCSEGGCERCKKRDEGKINWYEYEESCICIHAEQNAIIQAAYLGSSTKGSALYSTTLPCVSCSKMIINAGIISVMYKEDFQDKTSIELLKSAGLKVHQYVQ